MSSGIPPLVVLINGNDGQGDDVVCAHLCPLSPLNRTVELLALGVGETASPLRRVNVTYESERRVLMSELWSGTPDMTFHTRAEIEAFFAEFEIVRFREQDEDGEAVSGPKHWHVFHVIARKQS